MAHELIAQLRAKSDELTERGADMATGNLLDAAADEIERSPVARLIEAIAASDPVTQERMRGDLAASVCMHCFAPNPSCKCWNGIRVRHERAVSRVVRV